MKHVKGFRIIDIPLGTNIEGVHPLYIKEHSSNKADQIGNSSGRIIFVGNIDYRINMSYEDIDAYLRLLFSRFGDIKEITVSSFSPDSTASTRFAHVEFSKKSTVKFALGVSDEDYAIGCREVAEKFGFETYFRPKTAKEIRQLYSYKSVDHGELQKTVDAYMIEFDKQEAVDKQAREAALHTVDEDGFMPVKNRNKRKRASDSSAGTGSGADHKRGDGGPRSRGSKKSKGSTELTNFYRFQIREQKVKELATLRQKFAEDKERVARLREARKFKPF